MTGHRLAFRAYVLGDAERQVFLDEPAHPDDFLARSQQLARAAGLTLDRDAMNAGRRGNAVAPGGDWAPEGWLPVAIVEDHEGTWIDWARFGTRALDESFYDDSIRRALARPFNQVFRHATRLDEFIDGAPSHASAPLGGMIFHMSRCGSTLVAQLLAALPRTISLSEPGPLDAAIRYAIEHPEVPRARRIALLRAMAAALARPRDGETRSFVKLDSWHVLAMPLLLEAFPQVPWIYLFREPIEVLVSQMRQRGYQTVPALLPPGLYGADAEHTVEPETLCARIFARHHAAALAALPGAGIAIDYATLPQAFCARVDSHFALGLSATDRERVAQAASRNAKVRGVAFTADGAAKRSEAGVRAHDAAARHLADLHARLLAFSRADRGGP